MTRCAATSTVQMFPSWSTLRPCAAVTGTSVQAWSILPDLSNSITGCAPRLNTQTLSSLSTDTPEHSPKFQPGRELRPVHYHVMRQRRTGLQFTERG
jgi:hypothetical protein